MRKILEIMPETFTQFILNLIAVDVDKKEYIGDDWGDERGVLIGPTVNIVALMDVYTEES